MKGALIIGITGQAGGDLAEFLLEIGYEIQGQKRK
jgi:GDP-D-mannose dehydratase